jgi:ATP-binding cassette, subfamily B, bacterial
MLFRSARLLKPVVPACGRHLCGTFVRQILVVAGGYSLVQLLRVVRPGGDSPLWLFITALLAFDALLLALDLRLYLYFAEQISLPLFRRLRSGTLAKILSMPLEWHHRHNTLELVSKLNTGVGKFVQTAEVLGRELLPAIIRTSLSLVPLLIFSPVTAPVLLAALLGFLWLTYTENQRRNPYRSSRFEDYARDAGMFTECIQQVQPIVQLGQTGRVLRDYGALQNRIVQLGREEVEVANRFAKRRNTVLSIARRVSQGVWIWQYQAGKLDAAMVMYLSMLTDELIGSFWTYASVLDRMFEGLQPARTLTQVMDETPSLASAPGVAPVIVPEQIGIDLVNVTFGYAGGPAVLDGLNLRIEAASVVGIVGKSGIGKTTLQLLLSRGYDVQGGAIRIAGRDIREWPLDQLRGLFATVSQNGAVLFSNTKIVDAIRFARPEATLDDVIEAARCAAIDVDIESMPGGYATVLGPDGVQLSRGQHQRIALAQALIALGDDRKILILDEFTSALDAYTEHQILLNLRTRLRGVTVIVIAHRLATLSKLADKTVVLDRTGVVEEGTHRELVARNHGYAELARLQSA